jgi:hypothetical protein
MAPGDGSKIADRTALGDARVRRKLAPLQPALSLFREEHDMKFGGAPNSFFTTPASRRQQDIAAAAFDAANVGASHNGRAVGAEAAPDFTDITPNEMRDAATRLFQSGKIDFTELFMLQHAGVPLGKAGLYGEFVPLTAAEKESVGNTPLNYAQLAKNAIAALERQGETLDPKSGYKQWRNILGVLTSSQSPAGSTEFLAWRGFRFPSR